MLGTVFRVEHKDTKEGCYRTSIVSDFLRGMLHYHESTPDEHPNPLNDKGIDRCSEPDEYCGFKDAEQLLAWFTNKEIYQLDMLGFEIVELEEVEITAVGEKQVLFLRNQ